MVVQRLATLMKLILTLIRTLGFGQDFLSYFETLSLNLTFVSEHKAEIA